MPSLSTSGQVSRSGQGPWALSCRPAGLAGRSGGRASDLTPSQAHGAGPVGSGTGRPGTLAPPDPFGAHRSRSAKPDR